MKTILLSVDQTDAFINLIAVLIVLALLLTIGRMIAVWYFKINDRLREQKETNRLLKILVNKTVWGHTPEEKTEKKEGAMPKKGPHPYNLFQ